MSHPWNRSLQEIYDEYRPGEMVWLANNQLIFDVARDNPMMVANTLYEMWNAIRNHIETTDPNARDKLIQIYKGRGYEKRTKSKELSNVR